MSDAVDDDTEQAILTLWQQDSAGLMALFKQLPRTGRLKSTAPGADISATGTYAVVDSRLARKELVAADRLGQYGWNDYRTVTVTIYGVRADVVRAVQLFGALFNRKTGTFLAAKSFTYPSGARFVRWWPNGDAQIEEDKDTKAGKDIWRAICRAEVWSVRDESTAVTPSPAVVNTPAAASAGGITGQYGDTGP